MPVMAGVKEYQTSLKPPLEQLLSPSVLQLTWLPEVAVVLPTAMASAQSSLMACANERPQIDSAAVSEVATDFIMDRCLGFDVRAARRGA